MKRDIGSKTKNLVRNGDNLSLKDLIEEPNNQVYNNTVDDIAKQRKLGSETLPSSNDFDKLAELADKYDRQQATEAVEERKKELNEQ